LAYSVAKTQGTGRRKMKRKLKLQMQISVDGFVSTGPDDDQTWVTWALDEIYSDVLELLDSINTIIIGRKLAVDYIPFWQQTLTKPDHPMHGFAQRIVRAKKVVFTKTLDESVWDNTELAKGNLEDEINKLKSQNGKDVIVYGGSSFVSELIKQGLIDEFHFFVNPVALGKGIRIFDKLDNFLQLKLKRSKTYNCGINLLTYNLI
jgi:dihydrofolate reductase